MVSFAAGGCDVAATVVTLQQHCARIVEIGGAWCFLAFAGQQHDERTWPSMLHRKLVRAKADDGRSTAKVSRVRITRRTRSNRRRRVWIPQAADSCHAYASTP